MILKSGNSPLNVCDNGNVESFWLFLNAMYVAPAVNMILAWVGGWMMIA